jgi:hypothetical protein
MTSDWQRIDRLLDRLYAVDPEERKAILEQLEQTDADLAVRARRLLELADSDLIQPGGALATGVLAGVTASEAGVRADLPDRIGAWRLERELGRGGITRFAEHRFETLGV